MLCDVCKCNDATVFLTQILEGKMKSRMREDGPKKFGRMYTQILAKMV